MDFWVFMAIIEIWAAIVRASMNSARARGRDATRVTNIRQIQLALELYYSGSGNGSYPVATAECAHTGNARGLETLLTNNYIPTIPRDPSSTATSPKCYYYATPAAPVTTYHLGAVLEQEGGIALGSDSDFDSAAVSYTGAFEGNSNDCATDASTPDKCFDGRP